MSIGVFCVEVCRGDKALVGKESKPQKKPSTRSVPIRR